MKIVAVSRGSEDDAGRLTEIAFAAKRHWGYPEDWIQRWRAALTITPDCLAANPTFVARCGGDDGKGEIMGFGAVRFTPGGEAWIDHLWVYPSAMGFGIGRKLFEACETEARRVGASRLKIEADPHAEGFYRRMGASTLGREPAFMDGQERYLPLMEKALSCANANATPKKGE